MKLITLRGGLFVILTAFLLMGLTPEDSSARKSRNGKQAIKKASHSVVTSKKQRRAKLSKKYRRPTRRSTLTESEKSEIIEKINALAQAEVIPTESEELLPESEMDATEVPMPDDIAQAAREEAEEDDVTVEIDQFFAARPGAVDVTIDPSLSRERQLDFTLYDDTDPRVSATRSDVMQHIIDWLGTRYRFGGETRKGIDCSAFVREVFRSSFNVELPRTAEMQSSLGMTVNKDHLQFGDLVYFHTARHAWISHVGIYIGEGLFANASSSKGVTVASMDSKYWKKRYLFSKRLFTNTATAQAEISQALMASQVESMETALTN